VIPCGLVLSRPKWGTVYPMIITLTT